MRPNKIAALLTSLALGALLHAAPVPVGDDEPAGDAAGSAGGRVTHGEHEYQLFDDVEDLSWDSGRQACQAAGGDLVVINDQAEADFIAALSDDRYMFLGATDRDEEGSWKWVDGTPWGFTNWLQGQPNDYGGTEDFLATYDGGEWVDVEGSGDDFWMPTGYICEWSPQDR